MNELLRDLRHGFRLLLQSPGYACLAILALGLGIGVVTTQFSIINGAILRGLPFFQSDRLAWLSQTNPALDKDRQENAPSIHSFIEYRDRQTVFTGLAGLFSGTLNVTCDGTAYRYTGARISHNFLELLGVKPLLGRGFTEEEDQPGKPPSLLLSYAVWKNDFASDPAILGKVVRVNGQLGPVVGVMPEGFMFPQREQCWVPLNTALNYLKLPRGSGFGLVIFGRLKDGVSFERASAEMTTVAAALARDYPDSNGGYTVAEVRPLIREQSPDWLRERLYVLFGAVVFVLLIACANVANLQLARSAARHRELAVRSALGASRRRLIRQMLAESVAVAVAGAILGIFLSRLGTSALLARAEQLYLPYWYDFSIDWRILAAVIFLTVTAGLLSGLFPALQSSRVDLNEVLKDNSRTSSSLHLGRWARWMVIAQIALSCLLLIGSGLMIRTLLNQERADYGYDLAGHLMARAGLFEADYPDARERYQCFRRILDTLQADPRVTHAATSGQYRFWGANGTRVTIDGQSYVKEEDYPFSRHETVSAEYFDLIGVQPLAGRFFQSTDVDGNLPVVVVNASFAKKHWPNQDPLGRRIKRRLWQDGNTPGAEQPPWRVVVGVAPDMRLSPLWDNNDQSAGTAFYEPMDATNTPMFMTVNLKGHQPPLALAEVVRAAVRKVDPNLPLYSVATPAQLLDEDLAQIRFITSLFGVFGLIAVFLAAVGIYGIMSFSVNQRTQEIGIRMALGARARHILRLILRQGAIQAGMGVTMGLALSYGLSRFLAVMLFDVSPTDPATFAGVVTVLVAVAMGACLLPAWRASRVHPVQAIRYD